MDINLLDLNRLTMDDIDFSGLPKIIAEDARIEKECKDKYGDDWWEHYVDATLPNRDIDSDEKLVNLHIYDGCMPFVTGILAFHYQDLYLKKLKRLFGPFYKRYINHKPNDPKVNKALIKDALKSGKWKELPKELQGEYHKLAGD